MGVLKRTMESAPTRPKDNAKEDFTTMMTENTTAESTGRIDAI